MSDQILPLINKIDSDYGTAGTVTSVELFTALATNLNYMMIALPVGYVCPMLDGFAGISQADSGIWELCDGTTVQNVNSPIYGKTKPNFVYSGTTNVGKLLRASYTSPGEYGQTVYNLSHNHGGTQIAPTQTITEHDTDEALVTIPHAHDMYYDLGPTSFLPRSIAVNFYIKVI